MDEQKNTSDSAIILTEDSSLADILRALIAKEDGRTVKVLRRPSSTSHLGLGSGNGKA